MSIPFSPRAALCTFGVICAFVAVASAQLPAGIGGFAGFDREGTLPIVRGGSAAPDGQREILTAVLTYEARRPGRSPSCLRLAPEAVTFESERERIGSLQRSFRGSPDDRARIVSELDRMRNPVRPWAQAADPRLEQAPLPLNEEGRRQLRAAETALLSRVEPPRAALLLNLSELPAGLQSDAPGCRPLEFTLPAIGGDVAFVKIAYPAERAVQVGWLYAVARREDRWEVEALSPLSY